MILKLVWSVGRCGTKQQTLRDNAASCHDGSQGEDPILDPVDYLKVVSGKMDCVRQQVTVIRSATALLVDHSSDVATLQTSHFLIQSVGPT
ncbi:hypothetical protein E2C01_063247 [Portunus trituberculatus]|uniref:Uncharacterized protein n=1 Tax=Portunus trituberculatus TaxID=210409 RepID=A0A5B7HKA7_PORTR|nr:hypothetical protein [Portunus trituberculatus]